MPRRKYYKKKRKYRRRRKPVYPLAYKSPMPKTYMTKLRYAELGLSVNPGVGTVGTYLFRANDCFDPNFSGVGHQPRGFDQIMALFNHFTVLGSKITIRVSNPDEANTFHAFLTTQAESTVSTSPTDFMERQDVRTKQLGTKNSNMLTTLTQTFSTKKFFTRSNPLDDTALRGSSAAGPAEGAYYHFGVIDSDGSSDPTNNFPFSVVIDYIVVFHEPNDVSMS